MKTCAFLTMRDLTGFVTDDALAVEPLAALGWKVHWVPWREPVDWARFHAVIIRTPWDYPSDPAGFLRVLQAIDESPAHLENELELVRWNIRKTYLRDLAAAGVPVVPTEWCTGISPRDMKAVFAVLGVDDVVVKPVIGANAHGAFRLTPDTLEALLPRVEAALGSIDYLAQPFVRGILDEGEYSLFFFNGEHSHSILKKPAPGDYRVQEEHGGEILPLSADDELLACARRALRAAPLTPLYARVDLVRAEDRSFVVMELELVEPSLYLRMDPAAPERFARAFDARMRGR